MNVTFWCNQKSNKFQQFGSIKYYELSKINLYMNWSNWNNIQKNEKKNKYTTMFRIKCDLIQNECSDFHSGNKPEFYAQY